jgi:hypothetical protein
VLSVNLYAAARSVQLSHRLQRPTSLGPPTPLGIVAILAAAAAWALHAPAFQYDSLVAGGLGAAFAFKASPLRTPCRAASSSDG